MANKRHIALMLAPARQRPTRSSGFTLIEVLVALFIMSILALLAWRGIDGLVRARDSAKTHAENTLRLSAVLGQWEQDLRQLQRTPAAPVLRFDGAALRLTRRSPEGLRIIVWTLQEGALYRWASPPLTSAQDLQTAWTRAQQWAVLKPQALRVLEEARSWQVYYYRTGDSGWSNAQSSGNAAAAAASSASDADDEDETTDAATAVPAGVRLLLELPQGKLTRDLQLPPNP